MALCDSSENGNEVSDLENIIKKNVLKYKQCWPKGLKGRARQKFCFCLRD